MNIKKKRMIILFLFIVIFFGVLMRFPKTQPWGWMFFGTWFLIPSLRVLYLRIEFDISEKFVAEGELVILEKIQDDMGTSYRPIYKYTYHDEVLYYKIPVSSFLYRRTKKIRDKETILIFVEKPTRIRLKKYLLLEYIVYLLLY